MKNPDQKLFVRELTETVLSEVLSKAGKWPEGWDGHELRQLLADAFVESASISNPMHDRRGPRRQAYENVRSCEGI